MLPRSQVDNRSLANQPLNVLPVPTGCRVVHRSATTGILRLQRYLQHPRWGRMGLRTNGQVGHAYIYIYIAFNIYGGTPKWMVYKEKSH